MATGAPWDSDLFLLAIVGYLAFNLYRAVVQRVSLLLVFTVIFLGFSLLLSV